MSFPIAIWNDFNVKDKKGIVHAVDGGNYTFVSTVCGKMFYSRSGAKPTKEKVTCKECMEKMANKIKKEVEDYFQFSHIDKIGIDVVE